MNWHETIVAIRKNPEFADLVRYAYFEEDLSLNVERFGSSEEFAETMALIKEMAPEARTILDIGAGNGISSVNFALKGYEVTVVEPDPSDSVGANAIRWLQGHYQINNMLVHEAFAENIGFESESFDIVYVRQAMHHAYELPKFIAECARVLKPGGILLTIRDHVVFDQQDKEWFLKEHPLHKFYGGENAFTPEEYKTAMTDAGLTVIKEMKFFDSIINYFPISRDYVENYKDNLDNDLKMALKDKIGFLSELPFMLSLLKRKNKISSELNELDTAGRMYSYVSKKMG